MTVADLQRRILIVVSAAQVLSGFGLVAGITVGALLAAELWDSAAAAGLPAVLMTAGAAGAALLIARISDSRGRRVGLASGYAAGAIGAWGVIAAAVAELPALVLASFLVYGAGLAANLQARFAAADLAPVHRRATAMSIVLMATTAGAVLGPVSAEWSGSLAAGWGLEPLLGPFVVAGVACMLAAAVLVALLRPDPLLTARARGVDVPAASSEGEPDVPWRVPVAGGIGVMVIGQGVMVAIMTMTPVHLTEHEHGLDAVGAAIAWHVAAMYLPSPLSGWLVDRYGPARVAALSGVVLVAAGALAASSGAALGGISAALVLLGLGWSLAMVAGSAVLATRVPPRLRPRLQGRADALTTLAGASGAGLAGVVAAGAGYATLAWGGAAIALLALPLALVVRVRAGTMSAS
ncbi:MFS transporter [Demequina sp. SYSU T00192]|uniref:MFS transporter n=1 Tax=Demequina litoralis TaxID=3051660 RepID=A0ABT8GAW8_9MICO|nr:MFS transporter [Demequina sp. SYSU T00192]MDN4476288.1 MFS transporter [Demequina sp. SYSU T00192]